MKKKLIALALAAAFVLSAVGCDKTPAAAEYGVSYARSTVTLRADGDAVGTESALIFTGVKNEYESAQIFITAKETDVSGVSLETADLTSGENVIGKENFTVCGENYYMITETENDPAYNKESIYASPYPAGIYPDGLIPQDLWSGAGENVVPAGETRGLWVSLYIPEDAAAGVYTGTFALNAGGQTKEVPVSVKVYDYTLSDENTMRSLFLMRNDYTFNYGELDSTVEMQRKYYDFLLEYRINAYNIPIESYKDVSYFVESIEEYYDDPKVSTYGLPASTRGNGSVPSMAVAREQVLALAEACENGKNYLSKLVIKNGDETDLNGSWTTDISSNNNLKSTLESAAEEVLANPEKYAGYIACFDSAEAAAQAIRDIPIVDPLTEEDTFLTAATDDPENPATNEGKLLVNTGIWCPKTDIFEPEFRDTLYAAAEKYGVKEMWWYTANIPTYPQPTYHIDTNPLSARVMSWMQRDYNIAGNLYWGVAYADDGQDVYTETDFPSGDGCLLYPGAKYDHDGPLPSMRLERIRDGIEEYELLGALEEKLSAYAAEKGIAMDVDAVLGTFYERLYVGTQTYDGAANFDAVREEMLAMLAGDLDAGVLVTDVENSGSAATVTLYAEGNFVPADAAAVKDGKTYTVSVPLSAAENYVEGTLDGESVKLFVARGAAVYTPQTAEGVTMTEGGVAAVTEGELSLTVAGKHTGDTVEDALFIPKAEIPLAVTGETSLDLGGARTLTVYLRNESGRDVKIWLYLTSASGRHQVRELLLPQGGGVIPVLIRADLEDWADLGAVTGIAVETENAAVNGAALNADLAFAGVKIGL